MENLFKSEAISCEFFSFVKHRLVSFDDVEKLFKESIKKGFEGLMVKNPYAEYKFGKRTADWLKFKKKDREIWTCIGIEEGKRSNMIGALICVTPGRKIVKVGNGFTEEERKKFYKNPPIGKKVEVEVTISPQKNAIAIFPVFIRIVR